MSPLDRLRWAAAVASCALPATCYRLAAHMAMMAADGTGVVWASRATLAGAMGCDKARFPSAFRAMEAAGFLVRGDLVGPVGRRTYRWTMAIPGAEVAPVPHAEPALGAESAPPAEVACPPPAEVATDPLRKSHANGGSEGGSKGGILSEPRSESPPDDAPAAMSFATKGGGTWTMTPDLLALLTRAHPGKDVPQELHRAAAWLACNPAKAKTAAGMKRFLNGWMERAAGAVQPLAPFPVVPPEDDEDDDDIRYTPPARRVRA
jgi:hypothetical protein